MTQPAVSPAATAPPAAAASPAPLRWLRPAIFGVLAVSVLVRLTTRSALWLDETLSVNIARLPLSQLPDALREDGSPPLYYLVLHGWIALFGTGDVAVRALSSLAALAALPLMWVVADRLHGRVAAVIAVLLLGTSPFAVHYATEARMYALVVLLVLVAVLALHRAAEQPTRLRLGVLGLMSGLLLLTHYWSFFLVAAAGAAMLLHAMRGPDRRTPLLLVGALASGIVLFAPWVPSMLFQLQHTGTPWARAPRLSSMFETFSLWAGGNSANARLLALLLIGLGFLAVLGRASHDGRGHGVLLGLPTRPVARDLAIVVVGTVALGITSAIVLSSGYAPRYSSVALAPGLLLAAIGASVLPSRARIGVVALAVVLGLAGSLPTPFSTRKTQAAVVAGALRTQVQPGDAIVYCPDQLGPAVSRLLPAAVPQYVYPSLRRPERVNWVDYAERNAAGDPDRIAADLAERVPGAIWLVTASGYRTLGNACTRLDTAFDRERGGRAVVVERSRRYAERSTLLRFARP